jgi:hypothetical protein
MFNLGIRSVTVALGCPAARRIVVIDMVDGSFALMYPGGKVEWVKASGGGLFDEP